MKTCSDCGVSKAKTAFGVDRSKKDGLRPQCKPCRRIARQLAYAANPEPHKERAAKFRKENPGYNDAAMKNWYLKNKPVAFARAKKWAAENQAARCEMSMRRYAGQKKATPKWADLEKIKVFYWYATQIRINTGLNYQVDHIIPLRGKNVCGLHVENNLQILPFSENIKKGNKHEV